MLSEKEITTVESPHSRKMNGDSPKAVSTPPPVPSESSEGKQILILAATIIIVAAIVIVALLVRKKGAAQQNMGRGGQQIIPVLATTVQKKNVPVYLDGLGNVQAFNTVTVRALVDGPLVKIAFTEGQDVHAGDVMAVIDPGPYKAALEQAKGKKGTDEALLANARLDMKREVELYAAKVDSQQVYDTQKALVDQYVATVAADQAAIDSAQVQLDRTTITAPIDGRTGIRQKDIGNFVQAADTNGLVVLTQLRPISLVFTLPEQELGKIHEQMSEQSAPLKVLAMDPDNNKLLDEGTLTVIDNQIDTTTGTIRLKATFPNAKLKLWPGQWINTRLLLHVLPGGIVVPASAVQRGPNGPYVFVIDKGKGKSAGGTAGSGSRSGAGKRADASTTNGTADTAANGSADHQSSANANPTRFKSNDRSDSGKSTADDKTELLTVRIQPVTVAPQIEDGEMLVESGLEPGQVVVTDGQYKLQEGSHVKISSGNKASTGDGAPTNSTP